MAEIRLRLATAADFEQIKKVSLDALNDGPDTLFSYNFPHRHDYPSDNEYYWGVRLQPMIYGANSVVIVAEMPSSDHVEGQNLDWIVVGWAQWVWNTPIKAEIPDSRFHDSWGKAFGRMNPVAFLSHHSRRDGYADFSSFEGLCVSILRLFTGEITSQKRRDVNHDHYRAFLNYLDLTNDIYWVKKYPRNLELCGLYVLPSYQRLGVGSNLVRWGKDLARQANVVVGLQAVDGPKGFYEKIGFRVIGIMEVQAEGEDFRLPIHVMIWET